MCGQASVEAGKHCPQEEAHAQLWRHDGVEGKVETQSCMQGGMGRLRPLMSYVRVETAGILRPERRRP